MKASLYVFAILFLGVFVYLGFNKFKFPTFFIFDKTENTNGTVTETGSTSGIRGYKFQLVTYKYTVEDHTYTDKFKAGKREGLQSIGDKILIEYSVSNPSKNEVIGFYRNEIYPKKKPIKLDYQK